MIVLLAIVTNVRLVEVSMFARDGVGLTSCGPAGPPVTHCRHFARQSQRPSITANSMPASCAAMNGSTPDGAIPANVSDIERAIVTAGLAKDVEAVNQ